MTEECASDGEGEEDVNVEECQAETKSLRKRSKDKTRKEMQKRRRFSNLLPHVSKIFSTVLKRTSLIFLANMRHQK